MKTLAVIIGRAGSKGLPGKNSMEFRGFHMVAHSIYDAMEAKSINNEDIVVSSDDPRILDVTDEMMAGMADDRPPELATDTASVQSVLLHVAEHHKADIYVLLYICVPIRPEGLIDRAVEKLIETGADSVQSYVSVGKYHPYWMAHIMNDDEVCTWDYSAVQNRHIPHRRQDLPTTYIPDGGVIAVTRESLMQADPFNPHSFLGTDRRAIITQPGEVVDIDTAADLERLETCHG